MQPCVLTKFQNWVRSPYRRVSCYIFSVFSLDRWFQDIGHADLSLDLFCAAVTWPLMTAKHSVSAGPGSVPVCCGWGSLPGGRCLVFGSPLGSLPHWQVKGYYFVGVMLFGPTTPIWRFPLCSKSGGLSQIPSVGSWPRSCLNYVALIIVNSPCDKFSKWPDTCKNRNPTHTRLLPSFNRPQLTLSLTPYQRLSHLLWVTTL